MRTYPDVVPERVQVAPVAITPCLTVDMPLSKGIVHWPEESTGQAWVLHEEGYSGKEIAGRIVEGCQ